MNNSGLKGAQDLSISPSCFKQGQHCWQITLLRVLSNRVLKNLQRSELLHLSEQSASLLGPPHSETILNNLQRINMKIWLSIGQAAAK